MSLLVLRLPAPSKFNISAGTLILFVVYAHIKPLHILQPIFDWLAEGMANVNELLDWLLKPVGLILKNPLSGYWFCFPPHHQFLLRQVGNGIAVRLNRVK